MRKSEQYIPGIFNYCDRWCAHCGFTDRCKNFEPNTVQPDSENAEGIAETVLSHLETAMTLLHKAGEDWGIDLDTMDPEEAQLYTEKETGIRTAVQQHILISLCNRYLKTAADFVRKNEGYTDRVRELANDLYRGMRSEESLVYKVRDIGGCFDTLQWYLYFIEAKLRRALHGKLDPDMADQDDFPKDSDGSAKIALIAIENSMQAWTKLHEILLSSEDIALYALSILSQLKKHLLIEFPDAPLFKRPGFDDLVQ